MDAVAVSTKKIHVPTYVHIMECKKTYWVVSKYDLQLDNQNPSA